MKTLKVFFVLFLFLPAVFSQDIIQNENGWEFGTGSFFSWVDSSLTRNFIVEDEFGNHFQSFNQYGGTTEDNGFYFIGGGWTKVFESFVVPDSINIRMKTGELTNTTKVAMFLGVQYLDHWILLGDQEKEIPMDGSWKNFHFDMLSYVKTVMDSIDRIYLEFAIVATESCYVGGVVFADNLLKINNGVQSLIDGFGDDYITGIKVSELEQIPSEYVLSQNYPNPFNPSTKIRFSILEREFVNLIVFNSLGEEVKILLSEEKEQGSYEVNFDASDLPNGVYFYKLQAGSFVETRKMILLR